MTCLNEYEYIAELKEDLTKGIVHVQFKKLDDSIRNMHCTLDPIMIPESKIPANPTPENAKYTRVFDLDVGDWRSFINANVIQHQWSGKTFIIARPELLRDRNLR